MRGRACKARGDGAIREKLQLGKSGEKLFFELAIEDLAQAADLFRPIYDKTNTVDGWTSLEVSPPLAHDTKSTLAAVKDLYNQAGRPNLFIKIPGTKENLPAIEEASLPAGQSTSRSCSAASINRKARFDRFEHPRCQSESLLRWRSYGRDELPVRVRTDARWFWDGNERRRTQVPTRIGMNHAR